MHLIDTSVWIDFLRGTSNPKIKLLEGLLEEGDAHLCEITFAEICFGARDHRQLQKYERYFSALPFLPLPLNWHRELSKMGHLLRMKGHQPFVADLMIALTAIAHRATLLTNDSDFKPYADLFGLEIQ